MQFIGSVGHYFAPACNGVTHLCAHISPLVHPEVSEEGARAGVVAHVVVPDLIGIGMMFKEVLFVFASAISLPGSSPGW